MTSRHNERLQARRQALREQHKRELEEAKRRQAAQLASITTFDQRIAKLEDAKRDVAGAVAEAVAAFGGRRDAAAALGLTTAEVRDYLNTWNEQVERDTEQGAGQEEKGGVGTSTAEGAGGSAVTGASGAVDAADAAGVTGAGAAAYAATDAGAPAAGNPTVARPESPVGTGPETAAGPPSAAVPEQTPNPL
ncbi:hypothetical protein [Streptomyces sp. B15]|uniref:hypothetical protein n=1 Tax=Streptomyces sp. B15 TaxID=1537797 RepID=UPI001B36A6E6|nr:hypothetical protein [Streptomyces sp. B15]MBQ1122455.1 hypothetical protein [Streptomyces sp. B15]